MVNVARTSLRTKVSFIILFSFFFFFFRKKKQLFIHLKFFFKVHQELADSLTESLVDAVLTIQQPNQKIDLHMIEIQKMMHKTDMDTQVLSFAIFYFLLLLLENIRP